MTAAEGGCGCCVQYMAWSLYSEAFQFGEGDLDPSPSHVMVSGLEGVCNTCGTQLEHFELNFVELDFWST
jgi:hypothetical protein